MNIFAIKIFANISLRFIVITYFNHLKKSIYMYWLVLFYHVFLLPTSQKPVCVILSSTCGCEIQNVQRIASVVNYIDIASISQIRVHLWTNNYNCMMPKMIVSFKNTYLQTCNWATSLLMGSSLVRMKDIGWPLLLCLGP